MSATVAAIVDKQTAQYGLISRAVANVKKLELKKRTPEQIQTRIEILDSNWKKFQENHDLLSSLKPEERSALPYFTDRQYEQCEEVYIDQKSELLSYLNKLKSKTGETAYTASTAPGSSHAPTSRQLRRLNVPSFSGSYREWRPFRDLFSAMIGRNKEIPDFEKLQYLNMSATGEAAQLVKKFELTDENFARAWQELVDRYENKRVLIDTHLSTLFSLPKVTQQSHTALKALIGEVKESLEALNALGCPTDTWDRMIVYMVTRKLDSESLLDWEMQIGATTEPATFEELQKFISGRIHALEGFARASTTRKSRSAAPAATKGAYVLTKLMSCLPSIRVVKKP